MAALLVLANVFIVLVIFWLAVFAFEEIKYFFSEKRYKDDLVTALINAASILTILILLVTLASVTMTEFLADVKI